MSDAFSPMHLQQAARLLGGEVSGEDVGFARVGTDSRRLPAGALFVALVGPNFDGHDFIAAARERGACAALVSRWVADPLPQLRVADTLLSLGQLGAAWRERFAGPLIALTGSNGKTTLKEMIAAILRIRGPTLATEGNLNNDIGVPLTLLRLGREHAYAVIEMGANHPCEIAYLTGLARPDVAIINNAGPCHLEGFGDVAGVAHGKGEIFQGLGPEGVAVINRDDPFADYWVGLNPGRRIVDFGLDRPAAVSGRMLDPATNQFRLQRRWRGNRDPIAVTGTAQRPQRAGGGGGGAGGRRNAGRHSSGVGGIAGCRWPDATATWPARRRGDPRCLQRQSGLARRRLARGWRRTGPQVAGAGRHVGTGAGGR